MTKSRAAVQVADQHYQLQEFDLPSIGPDDGLLRVEASGMCGSDVEAYDGALRQIGVNYPIVTGHEPVGTIVEIGAEAARRWNVKVGDRVAVEPVLGCGYCRACLGGRYRRCDTGRPGTGVNTYGFIPTNVTPALWGGYAEYMYLDPRSVLHKVSPELPIELAVMYQPIAAGIRWFVHDSGFKLGDTVVILGCGQRGLAGIVAAREAGAGTIIVTGLARDAHKLELARVLGADATIVVDAEDTVEAVDRLTGGQGADVVVDVSTAVQPVVDAIDIVKQSGTVVLAGVKGSGATASGLVPDKIVLKEITVKGLFGSDFRAFEPALRLIESRKYPLELMHTHTFSLDEVPKAIETLAGRVQGEDAIHVMIDPHRE